MAFTSSSTNPRVFYPMQGLAIGDMGATTVVDSWQPGDSALDGSGKLIIPHGVQSFNVTTNFNNEPIFELGQLSLYENYEEVPDIEISSEKVLDGYSLLYHLGTVSAVSPTLVGRANARADIRAAIGLTTDTSVQSGNSAVAEMYASGTYLNSVSYSLTTEGNFTESVSFVGNDKEWIDGAGTTAVLASGGTIISAFSTSVFGNDTPVGVNNSVLRRQNVVVGTTGKTLGSGVVFRTVVPNFIPGVGAGYGIDSTGLGVNCGPIEDGSGVYINSVSISADLGREQINQLGTKLPYFRYVSFPVEVSTDLEITATGGDNINAASNAQNLSNHSIQFVLDDSTVLSLGNKNKLTSVSYGGGDAGNGNVTITYSMSNQNDLVVLHSGDPIAMSTDNYFNDWFA